MSPKVTVCVNDHPFDIREILIQSQKVLIITNHQSGFRQSSVISLNILNRAANNFRSSQGDEQRRRRRDVLLTLGLISISYKLYRTEATLKNKKHSFQ